MRPCSDHISCKGPEGACLVTAGPGLEQEGTTPGWQPFENERFVVSLEGNVNRLAHHRSSECGYWAQPRATWSKTGRWVAFSSDWSLASCETSDEAIADTYLIDLDPACAKK
jgi:hypothetical protein